MAGHLYSVTASTVPLLEGLVDFLDVETELGLDWFLPGKTGPRVVSGEGLDLLDAGLQSLDVHCRGLVELFYDGRHRLVVLGVGRTSTFLLEGLHQFVDLVPVLELLESQVLAVVDYVHWRSEGIWDLAIRSRLHLGVCELFIIIVLLEEIAVGLLDENISIVDQIGDDVVMVW